MSEIHFIVEEAPEGGYVARAVGVDILTEADDLPSLHAQVRDAVHCHFDEGQVPGLTAGRGLKLGVGDVVVIPCRHRPE
ncbi:MAG: hypothetical protein LT080_02625 [Thiobacillus sp.]|nr:hypothetical protein [Thiobacillus sp.]